MKYKPGIYINLKMILQNVLYRTVQHTTHLVLRMFRSTDEDSHVYKGTSLGL